MLTKTQADKWIEALRSGKYKQTRTTLYNGEEGFCCLGVLAKEILNWEAVQTEMESLGTVSWPRPEYGGCMIDPHGRVEYDQLPFSIIPEPTQTWLMSMNDDDNKTFPEIADQIEKNLHKIVGEPQYCATHDLFNCWYCG